jgi:hypothetical protein
LTSSWKWPVGDEIEFGLGWTVAVRSDVVTDVFDAIGEERTFLELESDTVFLKNVANAGKVIKESGNAGRP